MRAVINQEAEGLGLALGVDGAAMISLIPDSIVRKEAYDWAITDSIILGSCLSRWEGKERIISYPNDIDSTDVIPFKDLGISTVRGPLLAPPSMSDT